MPSEDNKTAAAVVQNVPEKPFHYMYLKEFRTQQCQDFLQHKCQQHRPFTCFHWHFMNQRRRRPIRRRDGTFNYSPDIYCDKFDEQSGICPNGDDCPYLHRTAGDTERRYHLRYYKTSTCVHETDSRGYCVKNGPHCAFAHGPHDLRPAVYDIRELQAQQQTPGNNPSDTNGLSLPEKQEKNMIVNEDPKWNDTNFVLANYKTESCKRPPRLCRQGYACPQYHNSRDRRRSPRKFKYRSTPCPNVKHGDEWGDPSLCENGDNCQYCHTRTEQQFHPEIYKSTKCNDMQQTNYCPRGPFCAFAHVERDYMYLLDASPFQEDNTAGSSTGLDDIPIPSSAPPLPIGTPAQVSQMWSLNNHLPLVHRPTLRLQVPISAPVSGVFSSISESLTPPSLNPIGKPRSQSSSTSSSFSSDTGLGSGSSYQKAPGSEREDSQAQLKKQLQLIDSDPNLDEQEKLRRAQNLLGTATAVVTSVANSGPLSSSLSSMTTMVTSSTLTPTARPFYPASDTVESVVGSALEDMSLDDFDVGSAIDKELDNESGSAASSSAGLGLDFMGSNSLSNSLSQGILSGAGSTPVSIPGSLGASSTHSQSPPSPLGQLPPAFIPQHIQQQQHQQQQIEQAQAAFLSQPAPEMRSLGFMDLGSQNFSTRGPHSPLLSVGGSHSTFSSTNSTNSEVQRLQDELNACRTKLQSWEESWQQAKQACDAWKKEASEYAEKAKAAEKEKLQAIVERDEVRNQAEVLRKEIENLSGGPHLHVLQKLSDMEKLPLTTLRSYQQQLRQDLERLDKVIYQLQAMKCLICQERNRCVAVMPCNHYVMCEICAPVQKECPYCHLQIQQRSTVVLPQVPTL
ncbi:putative E3 ubiquitin-protein ligase UNKL isoform X2 [Branchiostoma lanceolatum]|uniref:putative E3 ubiquitin-protein ligase UNKL isoform X2 n=1 Tax=Branchiostoma lanceolatum TaxID=7740 RepID=UPI0034511B8A